MDSRDMAIAEALIKLESLAPCTDQVVFKELAILDKLYGDYPMYQMIVNGTLVNLGGDLRNTKVLSAAVTRLNRLIADDPKEIYYWQLGSAYDSIGVIKCCYPPNIETLVNCDELVEARKWYSQVQTENEFCLANTNSANILDTYSRNYEAILLYNRVLKRNPDFGMALGNKAIALLYFFNISATGNPAILIQARDLLKETLQKKNTRDIGGDQSVDNFLANLVALESFIERGPTNSLPKCRIALEDLPPHVQFFKEHEMFLNFCFDCRICEAGLKDSVFPDLIEKLTETTKEEALVYGSFSRRIFYCLKVLNHIFEDFAAARWMFFQAWEHKAKLFEFDEITRYVSTLDYTRNASQYGLLKSVFTKLFGILDKVAYAVFFNYSIGRDHVVFEDILRPEVREIIVRDRNYQLLALHSLARDFQDGGLYNRLRRTRNHITHRFLDIGEIWEGSVIEDGLSEQQFLTLDRFEASILEMFSLAKAAVFYFLNGIRADYNRERGGSEDVIQGLPVRLQGEIWEH